MVLMVNVLIYLLVFGLIYFLIQHAPVDEQFKRIAQYVLLVVFVICLINVLAGGLLWGPIVVR